MWPSLALLTALALVATLTLVSAVLLRPGLAGRPLTALARPAALTAVAALLVAALTLSTGAAPWVPPVLLSLVVASSSHGESHARVGHGWPRFGRP